MSEFIHIPVLSQELISGLNIIPGGHYLDATVGGGGHSSLILNSYPDVQVTALDRDKDALAAAKIKLADYGDRVDFFQSNFADYEPQDTTFNGIIADLGVSSAQLDIPERGFSFQHEASLDMRMDRRQNLTAAEIVNHWQEVKLREIFSQYGEERFTNRIAKTIVASRPFQTTTQLASAIRSSVPAKYRHGRIHPATRVFQALRIAVNGELESLERFLNQASQWLKPEGYIGIISFHSLEDRIVKHHFRNAPQLRVITKKPIIASLEEQEKNRRSRSAKLRFAQKIALNVSKYGN